MSEKPETDQAWARMEREIERVTGLTPAQQHIEAIDYLIGRTRKREEYPFWKPCRTVKGEWGYKALFQQSLNFFILWREGEERPRARVVKYFDVISEDERMIKLMDKTVEGDGVPEALDRLIEKMRQIGLVIPPPRSPESYEYDLDASYIQLKLPK